MFEYIMIALLSVLTIILAMAGEKEKRAKLNLIIELENSKETTNSLFKEYNTKVKSLNQMIRDNSDLHQQALNRLEDTRNEVTHYKDRTNSLVKEVNSLQNKLKAQCDINNELLKDNKKILLKCDELSEQLLFATGAKEADKPQTDPVADSQGTAVNTEARVLNVRKPRRPRARGNKQSL